MIFFSLVVTREIWEIAEKLNQFGAVKDVFVRGPKVSSIRQHLEESVDGGTNETKLILWLPHLWTSNLPIPYNRSPRSGSRGRFRQVVIAGGGQSAALLTLVLFGSHFIFIIFIVRV